MRIVTGVVLDERTELTLDDLCTACRTSTEWLLELVEEGVLEPIADTRPGWHFTGESLARTRTAVRLHRDLGINLAGIALVLDLMEELERLRARHELSSPGREDQDIGT